MRISLSILFIWVLVICGCGKPAETSNTAAPPANAGFSGNTSNVAPPEFSGATNSVPGNAVNGAMKPVGKGDMAAPKSYEVPGKEGPAPDDSDIKTALGENLVQTRTFHSNPQLAKIEKTTAFVNGEPHSTVKVFLKNGQVKDLNTAAVKDPMSASAADILKAVH